MGHAELAKLLVERSYRFAKPGEPRFLLASGRQSDFYFDCQATTMFAPAMPLIGRAFLDQIRANGPQPNAVGGMTRGADPIAQAIAYFSTESLPVIQAFSVRKERKDHGTARWIEGGVSAGNNVVVVEDVLTSGGSTIRAIERCESEGLEIAQVVALVDRQEGGLQAVQERVATAVVSSIFTREQLDAINSPPR